jgi:Fur family ferric uptake transcriptional regulator
MGSHNPPMRRLRQPSALDDAALLRALERLHDVVRQRGLKSSSVRDDVARVALRRDGHFSVDDLAKELRERGIPGAHTATIYRVLPLLVDAGLIQLTLMSTRDVAHYERAFEREHHDHLICTACGKVVEFQFEAIEVLQRDIAEKFGFRLSSHVHELLGVCKDCRAAGS